MTGAGFEAWARQSVSGFADQQVASGLVPATEAIAYAERVFAEELPDGLVTPLHHFWTVRAGDDEVGHLWLRVRPMSAEVEAYVFDVEVVPEARGRGLGRAAMLAAEDAARDLGGTVMRLNVFGHNVPAVRLYGSLGYVVAGATMSCRLDPEAPVGVAGSPRVELRQMTAEEYVVFRPRLEADYAANIARAAAVPAAEARLEAADDLAALLPRGRLSEGHLLWTAYDGPVRVGEVWVQLRERSDGLHAFGYQLEVREELRRNGYGRAVVEAALHACRQRGAVSAGLSVFGSDDGARRIYEQAGFDLTAQTMTKPL